MTNEEEKNTKKCPYCDEEIAAAAKKCKHCGEWLEKESELEEDEQVPEEIEEEGEGYLRWIISTGLAAIAWALFYFGSWHFVLGKKVSLFLQYLSTGKLKSQNLIWDEYAIAFRINDSFWGFARDARFFDSPIIQWFMLSFSIVAMFYALKILIFGYND